MHVQTLRLKDLLLIQPSVFPDERGFFLESYRRDFYAAAGISIEFVQDNASFSKKHVLRGLHYQETPGQAKLVSVVHGRIWDVAVDIRTNSHTFGQWEAVELNDENHHQLFIPVGFAHGYCVLSDRAHVQYKVSATYNGAAERTIRFDDPAIGIRWPIQNPIISERDKMGMSLGQRFVR